jgi:hypothetical protein
VPTAGTIIFILKIAVISVTLLLLGSLLALAKKNYRLHGRINIVFFVLTLLALVGLEMIARVLDPALFAAYFESHQAQGALRVHLSFSMPSAALLPFMLLTGLRRRRAWHVGMAMIFLVLWAGTFITGVFFLPHADP